VGEVSGMILLAILFLTGPERFWWIAAAFHVS